MDSTTIFSTPLVGQFSGITAGDIYISTTTPIVTKDKLPRQYRLYKKKDGTLVLQGAFFWTEGWDTSGYDWEDLETINE